MQRIGRDFRSDAADFELARRTLLQDRGVEPRFALHAEPVVIVAQGVAQQAQQQVTAFTADDAAAVQRHAEFGQRAGHVDTVTAGMVPGVAGAHLLILQISTDGFSASTETGVSCVALMSVSVSS